MSHKFFHSVFIFILVLISLILVDPILAEAPSSYLLTIVRNGKSTVRVARNFWSGEYPTPIIDVKSKIKGTTKIKAYKSLRDISKSDDCTIQNGIYHPWSKSKGSLLEFFQLAPNREYTAQKNTTVDSIGLKKGDKITREIYLSEGSCEAVLVQPKKKEKRIEYTCDSLNKAGILAVAGKDDKFDEQWIYVNCQEGFKAFIQDTQLQKVSGVTEGQVVTYGEVKSSGDADEK